MRNTKIKTPILQKRPNNTGIIHVWDVQQGPEIPAIDSNGTLIVKYESISIILKITEKINDSEFTGSIVGFEPILEDNYNGLNIGDIIRFHEENIVSYSPGM